MANSKFIWALLVIILAFQQEKILAQNSVLHPWRSTQDLPDSLFIKRYDTLIHLSSWISTNQMEYIMVYNKDFKMLLAPNEISNLSFGLSYRYLDIGIGFSPKFMNSQPDKWKKGESTRSNFGFGFSMHRFHLSFDLNKVKGFYLKNSGDFGRIMPDSPYLLFPSLEVGYFSSLLRYNLNPKFSTASMVGGSQVQTRSAWTILPTLQFATFRFRNLVDSGRVQNEETHSTDLNFLAPVVGTLVLSPKFSFTLGLGPSLGVDFFKTVAIDDKNKIVLSKGTKMSAGGTVQSAFAYNSKVFYSGFEWRYRSYGHKLENLERLTKQYSYFQMYFGWRLRAPGFAKRTLDWVNKISPVKFE